MINSRYSFNAFLNYLFLLRLERFYQFNIRDLVEQLQLSQYWNLQEIKGQQLKDLNEIIQRSDLTWYEKKGHGPITVDKILNCSVGISKTELRVEFNKLYRPAKKEFIHLTSGSTGQPLKVIASNVSEAHRAAQRIRFYEWWGITPWDRNILIWGKMSAGQVDKYSISNKLKKIVLGKRELFISVFDLNETNIQKYYEQSLRTKATYIRGYASGVYQYCILLHKKNLNGKRLGLKLAIVTSEILLKDQREFMEEVLGCKVANEYGAAEIGLFACECPEGSMHINEELNLLQADGAGNLFVTDLHNTVTPLLNYEIGDRIRISATPCSCGRGLRVIDKIFGREGDLVKKPNGEFTSQYVFYYAAKEIDALGFSGAISQYKVIQHGMQFQVFLVKGPGFTPAAVDFFVECIKKNIGGEISVQLEFVEEIPKETSGKIRFFQRMDS